MSWEKAISGALKIEWDVVGKIRLDESGKITFPTVPPEPGLYQFHINKSNGGSRRYVGETDNLYRRFGHYRNPGPTQWTNLRLNALFRELLLQNEVIEVAIATKRAWMLKDNKEQVPDFSKKIVRRLFENFVLVMNDGHDIEDLNK